MTVDFVSLAGGVKRSGFLGVMRSLVGIEADRKRLCGVAQRELSQTANRHDQPISDFTDPPAGRRSAIVYELCTTRLTQVVICNESFYVSE